ncbi:hypothetical protein LTR95_005066 [Oleoguttula sp. CCFEE 5521]
MLSLARHQTATLTPLPCGATRVTLDRRLRAQAGSHAFLYLPGIAACQAHPFTLLLRDPVEFVVVARNGFTKKLHERACAEPGARLRVAIEGPYGTVPDANAFANVVIFAGGSGATFAFALATEWSRNATEVGKRLEIVWSIRDAACLQWFEKELAMLSTDSRITITVHVTQSSKAKVDVVDNVLRESLDRDVEKTAAPTSPQSSSIDIQTGRPDVSAIVKAVVESSEPADRLLVAACGPSGLILATEEATRSWYSSRGASVQLHVETFSV